MVKKTPVEKLEVSKELARMHKRIEQARRLTDTYSNWGYCESKGCENFEVRGWYVGGWCKKCRKKIKELPKPKDQPRPKPI